MSKIITEKEIREEFSNRFREDKMIKMESFNHFEIAKEEIKKAIESQEDYKTDYIFYLKAKYDPQVFAGTLQMLMSFIGVMIAIILALGFGETGKKGFALLYVIILVTYVAVDFIVLRVTAKRYEKLNFYSRVIDSVYEDIKAEK